MNVTLTGSGTGVIAGGATRAVLEYCEVHDILAKSLGGDNAINVVHATVAALKLLQRPEEEWRRAAVAGEDVAPAGMLKARPEELKLAASVLPDSIAMSQLKIAGARFIRHAEAAREPALWSLRRIRHSVIREDNAATGTSRGGASPRGG